MARSGVADVPVTSKLLLSVHECVALTGIPRTKIYVLMANKQLFSIKLGKQRLIPATALRSYLDRVCAEQEGWGDMPPAA